MHQMDFKFLSGASLLIMALETCNASASLAVDEATATLTAFTLDSYLVENISQMMHEALHLLKIMKTAFMFLSNTRSCDYRKSPTNSARNSIANFTICWTKSKAWSTNTIC
jgi:hypothetical protein